MFEEWFYYEGSRCSPLPSWCRAYGEIGQRVAAYDCTNRCLRVALAVPTRAYAALFVALGVVMAQALHLKKQDNEAYFDMLCGLPIGTQISYDENGKRYRAYVKSVDEKYGCQYLCIALDGEEARWVPLALCQQVIVTANTEEGGEIPERKYARRIPDDSEKFVGAAITDVDIKNFCRNSRLETLIVGVKALLKEELTVPLYVHDVKGTPQDILRVQHLLKPEQGYRSRVYTDRHNKGHRKEIPHVTFFDGANGFLAWRDQWQASRQIVILDKTEPRFTEAVDELNREYMTRANEQSLMPFDFPDAVECMVFETVKQ